MNRRWLGIVLLTPLMLGGCGSAEAPGVVPSPAGSPWVLVMTGSATPSPGPSGATVTPSPFATGFLPIASTSPAAAPSATGCPPPDAAQAISGATVVPRPTSAAVTWYNPGGDNLVEYRVTAIGQDLRPGQQRDVGWTVVTPGAACAFMTATVTGLDRSTDYVFSVDAVTTGYGRAGTSAATVARSGVVRTG